ncbi:MAG TPA: YceI family protein [Candidatus Dormibacteraeota bacterium]|nr:YceI family protein [Candidatus Dormibacteraeota bacterium]
MVTATVDREEFGLTWNMPLKAGGLLVGNEIKLTVGVEAVRQYLRKSRAASPAEVEVA